jgi:hypothetical protein
VNKVIVHVIRQGDDHKMKKAIILILLWVGMAMLGQPALARPQQQGGAASGSFGDPADMYLDFTITGADFSEISPTKFEGNYNGEAITLSGKGIVSRGITSSWVTLDANIMDQVFHYPPEGEDGYITGRTEEIPYQLSFTIPADYPHDNVNGRVKIEACAYNCGSYEVKFVVWLPEEAMIPPEAGAPMVAEPEGEDSSEGGLPLGAVVGGVAVVAIGGSVLVLGGIGALSYIRRQSRPKAGARRPTVSGDPEVEKAVQAWDQAARQAELEARKYAQQWEAIRVSGDPNDPAYQALQQQYQDYIDYKQNEAAEARRKIQEILEQEQQYQQEQRQQQAYRQHRQAENGFVEHEVRQQARRETDFDRSVKQAGSQGREFSPVPHEEALARLKESMEAIDATLKAQGVYVRNPYQGDPIYIINWSNQAINQTNDWMQKNIFDTPSQSITCQDYVDRTIDHVRQAVEMQFPGAKVESIIFQEKSSENPDASLGNWLDSIAEENHNLIKVTMPNGMEYALDFHQHNAHLLDANRPPIVRPWNGAVSDWKNYLGANEFSESLRTI